MSLLGCDVGTTGTKAVVFDENGNILSSAYREYRLLTPQRGWAELDPQEVGDSVEAVLGEAAKKSPQPVQSIALSALGEAITPLDANGKPLDNTVLSMDSRATAQTKMLHEQFGAKRFFETTGHPLHPMHTISKLIWWRENKPDVFRHAARFLGWQEIPAMRLGVPAKVDYSLASRLGLFDIRKKQWSEPLLALAGVDLKQLPEAVPSGAVVGEIPASVCQRLGLAKGCVFVAGGHDQPCAALGAGVVRPGLAVDGMGTVECITVAYDHPVTDENMLGGNLCCMPHTVDGMYASLAFSFVGGSLLRWFRDNFADTERAEAERAGRDVYDVLVDRAMTAQHPPFIVPHFFGTGTPYLDSHSKGIIVGLTLGTKREDIVRGILEGVAFEMRVNLEILAKAGVPLDELRCTGGGAKSRGWMQLKANLWGKRLCTLNVTEGGALACAMLGGVAIGKFKDLREAVERTVRVTGAYEPDMREHARYSERYAIYRELYPRLKEFLHRM
ncbi:MAG: FGGY family carbohydrate kinase [Verrucomicrobiae bacterium]|nr:FGGY family carbohydrate kinase [Verrucomicrobiae bacterium]